MSASPRHPGPSITLQMFLLLVATIVVAQAMTIIAVLLMPVIEPPAYSAAEIAGALRGERAGEATGRSLTRHHVDVLPKAFVDSGSQEPASRVAEVLGAAPDDVRFQRLEAPLFTLLTSGKRPPVQRAGNPMDNEPPGNRPPPNEGPPPDGPGRAPPPGGPGGGPGASGFQGEFTAAWRQPDGSWFVVEQAPELEWLRRLAIWFGGGLLVIAPIGYWFARRISAPVRTFAKAADTLGRDPEAPLMDVSGPAEIGAAADAFNLMQQRIQRYVKDRVGMVAAISHDLRTPLTRLRFKVEDADPRMKAAVLADVDKMEQMVGAVLAFLRDAAAASRRERVDLSSLVACVVDEASLKGSEVEVDIDEPLIVHADPVALDRLFANLVDNAVKYGGRARVSIARDGDEALVTIADDGPGLPPDDIEKVFAPFYRSGGARSDSKGVGLGLSIARSVARAHGGDVILRNGDTGLRAEVILPLAEAKTEQ